jgi:hypothetical protein
MKTLRTGEPRPHWSQQYMPKVLELIQAIRDHTRASEFSELWQPQTHTLPTGRSAHIVKRNYQRRRLVIWTDSSNTSAVWIGAAAFNGTDVPGPGDGMVPIAPGSEPFEMLHCGDVYAWSSSNGNVCVVQEYGRA